MSPEASAAQAESPHSHGADVEIKRPAAARRELGDQRIGPQGRRSRHGQERIALLVDRQLLVELERDGDLVQRPIAAIDDGDLVASFRFVDRRSRRADGADIEYSVRIDEPGFMRWSAMPPPGAPSWPTPPGPTPPGPYGPPMPPAPPSEPSVSGGDHLGRGALAVLELDAGAELHVGEADRHHHDAEVMTAVAGERAEVPLQFRLLGMHERRGADHLDAGRHAGPDDDVVGVGRRAVLDAEAIFRLLADHRAGRRLEANLDHRRRTLVGLLAETGGRRGRRSGSGDGERRQVEGRPHR